MSNQDEAELTETLPFECDSLAEEGVSVFKFERGDMQRFESDLTSTVFPTFVGFACMRQISPTFNVSRLLALSTVWAVRQADSAHQSKSEVLEYIFASAAENDMTTIGGMTESLQYTFALNIEENCKIYNEGMIKNRTDYPKHDSVRENNQRKDNQYQIVTDNKKQQEYWRQLKEGHRSHEAWCTSWANEKC